MQGWDGLGSGLSVLVVRVHGGNAWGGNQTWARVQIKEGGGKGEGAKAERVWRQATCTIV